MHYVCRYEDCPEQLRVYRIESRSGEVYGEYLGMAPAEALAAMHADGGGAGDAGGSTADWVIREVE